MFDLVFLSRLVCLAHLAVISMSQKSNGAKEWKEATSEAKRQDWMKSTRAQASVDRLKMG